MDPTALASSASVPNPEADAFAASSRDAINAIAAEFAFTPDDAEVDLPSADAPVENDPVAAAAARSPATPDASPAPAAVTPAAPAEDPAVQRGLDRLVAKEVEIARREAALQDFERQRPAVEAELRALRDQVSVIQRLQGGDPEDALAALGYDPNHAVQLILAKRMGDKAPPELKQALEKAALDRRIRELEERDAAHARAAAEGDYRAALASGARSHLATVPETSPLAVLRAHDAARAEAELLQVIYDDAAERRARGEHHQAPIITFEEAARRLEARYSFVKPTPAAPPPAASTTAPSTPASPGATPAATPAAAPKPPTAPRPLKPWHAQNQRELEEAGIKAGLAAARTVGR